MKNFKQRQSTTKPYEFWNSIQNQGFEFDPLWFLSERLVYTHTLHQRTESIEKRNFGYYDDQDNLGQKELNYYEKKKIKIDIFIYKPIKKTIMKGKNTNKEIKIITKFD